MIRNGRNLITMQYIIEDFMYALLDVCSSALGKQSLPFAFDYKLST